MPGGWHMGGWDSTWSYGHMIVPIVFWIIAAVVVAYLVQRLFSDLRIETTDNRALEILGERYAKGEIEREEYLRRRQDIKGP